MALMAEDPATGAPKLVTRHVGPVPVQVYAAVPKEDATMLLFRKYSVRLPFPSTGEFGTKS